MFWMWNVPYRLNVRKLGPFLVHYCGTLWILIRSLIFPVFLLLPSCGQGSPNCSHSCQLPFPSPPWLTASFLKRLHRKISSSFTLLLAQHLVTAMRKATNRKPKSFFTRLEQQQRKPNHLRTEDNNKNIIQRLKKHPGLRHGSVYKVRIHLQVTKICPIF